jgi:hypothetical protein
MDLEVREVKLVEEQAHVRARVKDEHTAEARELSTLVIEASNTLVDHGMLPIRDILQLPKMAQEILKVVGVILERLQEEHASSIGPWD